MSKSVVSASTVHSSKNEIDPWSESLELIDGKPLDSVKSDPRKLLHALSSIKHEYMWSNKTDQIARIEELMRKLNTMCAPPPYKRTRVGNSSLSASGTSKQATSKGPVVIKELGKEEFETLSSRIDGIMAGEELGDVTDLERQKLVFVARSRKENSMKNADYYEVEALDNVLEKLKTRVVKGKPYEQRISELQDELTRVQKAKEEVSLEREEIINGILMQKGEKKEELLVKLEIAEEEICASIPDPETVRFKQSAKLLEMRRNEQKWAAAGSYATATRLHKQADELEEEERKIVISRSAESSKNKLEKFVSDKNATLDSFEDRWQRKIDFCREEIDKKIAGLEKREAIIVKEIDRLRRSHRK